jgi:hypothetical protein
MDCDALHAMNTETIFFAHSGDVTEAHSWVTLAGHRVCLGFLASCRYCQMGEVFKQSEKFNALAATVTWHE